MFPTNCFHIRTDGLLPGKVAYASGIGLAATSVFPSNHLPTHKMDIAELATDVSTVWIIATMWTLALVACGRTATSDRLERLARENSTAEQVHGMNRN